MKFFSKKQEDEDLIILNSNSEFDIEEHLHSPDALTPQEVLGNNPSKSEVSTGSSPLDSLKKRLSETVKQAEEAKLAEENAQKEKAKSTLLDRCSPYFVDENGDKALPEQKPLYKLQSVADILGSSGDDDTLKRLSEKYGIDIGPEEPAKAPQKTQVNADNEVFEDKISAKESLKNVQSSIPLMISDIDPVIPPVSENLQNAIYDTATITFTPVNDGEAQGSHISVSTQTKPIDLTGELIKLNNDVEEIEETRVKLSENDFEEYIPPQKLTDSHNLGKLLRMLSLQKRNAFLSCVISCFLTVLLSIGFLPFMTELFLSGTRAAMIACSMICLTTILLNLSMFKAIPRTFTKACEPDSVMAIASILTLIYAVLGIIKGEIIFNMLFLFNLSLSFRALSSFWKSSALLSNYKLAMNNSQKNAVKLISDTAITFAMAKDAIEGDALVAAPCKTQQLDNFIKYSTYNNFLGGKLPTLIIVSLIISTITGIASAIFYDGVLYGLYAAATVQCFTALPSLFFIDNLPFYRTAKKLNKDGAMIAGKAGAEQLEMANAIVLNSSDLFPSGTITLHQMKVLSENHLDDTIIRAASLTEYMNSPLAPIFKEIVTSGNIASLPNTDTVKYEDRMGISGWVDNRLLFIGNRTLMEAHGIEVPSVEVDRKILRSGYFPVYVSTREKACALLIIQYNVNPKVAHELRRLTALGVTILVNSTDPNLTEEMICDYLGLYSDSVKVMSAAGCHMYKNAITPQKSISAPAAYKTNSNTLAAIINCANRIKKSNSLLTVSYILSAIFGIVLFAYASLGNSGELLSQSSILIYGLISTVVSYLLYLIKRP